MSPSIPRNGALSGMVIPGATAAVMVALGLSSSAFRSYFDHAVSPELVAAFFVSLVVMVAHKVESYLFHEYDQCPVYLSSCRAAWAGNPRQAQFVIFVSTFLGMMTVAFLALVGPPWHLIILTIWLAQGLHELHHTAKSLARRRVYPGVVSSVLFVAVMSGGVFPLWHDAVFEARGAVFYGYYALLPLVFGAFYLEDRRWTSRAPRALWSPAEPMHALHG